MSEPIRLYFVRHGVAEPNHPLGDSARRLTPEGREAFRAHAEALAGEASISRVVSSPYARARETAELLGRAFAAPVEIDDALGAGRSDGTELIRIARLLGDGTALVGHNPEMAAAIAAAAGREIPVPPGTVACVVVPAEGGRATLAWVR